MKECGRDCNVPSRSPIMEDLVAPGAGRAVASEWLREPPDRRTPAFPVVHV